jgi:hypothetical protein
MGAGRALHHGTLDDVCARQPLEECKRYLWDKVEHIRKLRHYLQNGLATFVEKSCYTDTMRWAILQRINEGIIATNQILSDEQSR